MKQKSSKGIVRTPLLKRTPLEKNNKRNLAIKWRTMREAEKRRAAQSRAYGRYKNEYLISLIKEATQVYFWTDFDIGRIKKLRKILEDIYDIPINFFCSFVYFSTYNYMKWKHRDLSYKNYIGFISNEMGLVNFANMVASKPLSWRKKNSRWPTDFSKKWGIKTSLKTQKIGRKDKFVEDDLMSDRMKRKINRHL